jgi:hypothetical protein
MSTNPKSPSPLSPGGGNVHHKGTKDTKSGFCGLGGFVGRDRQALLSWNEFVYVD